MNIYTNWSQEKTSLFIEEYRKYEALWNIRCEEYKSNNAKYQALKKLADKFDSDIETVKKKIKNLRTAFRREHKIVMQKKMGNSNKKFKWFAYDLLHFLLDDETNKSDFLADGDVEETTSENEDQSYSFPDDSESVKTQTVNFIDTTNIPHDIKDVEEDRPNEIFSGNKRKRNSSDYFIDDRTIETNNDCQSYKQHNIGRDEFTIYGEYVSNEIRKLRPKSQIVVKHLINNVLFNGAMGKYSNYPNCGISSRSSGDTSNSYPENRTPNLYEETLCTEEIQFTNTDNLTVCKKEHI